MSLYWITFLGQVDEGTAIRPINTLREMHKSAEVIEFQRVRDGVYAILVTTELAWEKIKQQIINEETDVLEIVCRSAGRTFKSPELRRHFPTTSYKRHPAFKWHKTMPSGKISGKKAS